LLATATVGGAMDHLFLPVTPTNKVVLELRGNGKSDLDLFADDHDNEGPKKRSLVREIGDTDKETGAFTPAWKGVATVKVQAAGRGALPRNDYPLTVACLAKVRGPIPLARSLPGKSADSLRVHFEASKAPVRMELRGDGDTVLELSAAGPDG